MATLFCMLLPVVFAVIAVGVPAVIDLVLRSENVPAWWGAPFLVLLPFALGALGVPAIMDPGMERVMVANAAWSMVHFAAAGIFLALSAGLAFSRGLRPGGDTLRRRRTTLAVIFIMFALMLLPWLPGMILLLWVVPPAWAGLFWVIALNRRGPLRLERGRSVSASLLFGAAMSFFIAAAHFVHLFAVDDEPLEIPTAAWVFSAIVLAGMAGGLRWLAGPPAPAPILGAALSALTLIFPMGWKLAFRPVPANVQAPQWVDFDGRSGPDLPAMRTARCLPIVHVDGSTSWRGPDCPIHYFYGVVVDARTPLDAIPPRHDSFFLVGDGRRHTSDWGRYGPAFRVEEFHGKAVVAELGEPLNEATQYALGPELASIIRVRAGEDRPLEVVRTPNWTMQDFISMCASMGSPAQCKLVP